MSKKNKKILKQLKRLNKRIERLERQNDDGLSASCPSEDHSKRDDAPQYCAMPESKPREFDAGVAEGRKRIILRSDKKWVNGTVLRYYFFDDRRDGDYITFSNGNQEWRTWTASNSQKNVVRNAFRVWRDVGIGLKFEEVYDRNDAEIRIGFMRGDGAWSYLGRDVLNYGPNERTMNFGWSLTRNSREIDTAIHEIGHSLGFPHEHQNPNSGIVWNEQAVIDDLAGSPNFWSREVTEHNVLRKLPRSSVEGTNWDPDSIMHYPFNAGLIRKPKRYRNGLYPAGGLSAKDRTQVRSFYPPLESSHPQLNVLQIQSLNIPAGHQLNFDILPDANRKHTIQTFGQSDTVMVLFEDVDGELRYVTADDDSGTNYNSRIHLRLSKNRKYVLRLRLYYSNDSGNTALMMW